MSFSLRRQSHRGTRNCALGRVQYALPACASRLAALLLVHTRYGRLQWPPHMSDSLALDHRVDRGQEDYRLLGLARSATTEGGFSSGAHARSHLPTAVSLRATPLEVFRWLHEEWSSRAFSLSQTCPWWTDEETGERTPWSLFVLLASQSCEGALSFLTLLITLMGLKPAEACQVSVL